MQSTIKELSPTRIKITISASEEDIAPIKLRSLKQLSSSIKVAGFREGKVPPAIAEKHIDPHQLQDAVIDEAANIFYQKTVLENNLRLASRPKVELTKFIPYLLIELSAEVDVIGKITLPDYKNIKVEKDVVSVSQKEVTETLERLQNQMASFKKVDRTAKNGDRLTIDFEGKDEKNEPVSGAKGKSYPLVLGSKSFIPGFEDNLIGVKTGQEKEFTIKFPKDYQVKALQSKSVKFYVKVEAVEEIVKDILDDKFATKVGPFKNLDDLKTDIKKQLQVEKQHQADHQYEEKIIKKIIDKTKVELPETIIKDQMNLLREDFINNIFYRGQSLDDYLAVNNKSEEQFVNDELRPAAIDKLKMSLVLSEIAKKENISVTKDEVEIRLQVLKNKYSDPKMQTELSKPEAKQEISSQLLIDKTINRLINGSKKASE